MAGTTRTTILAGICAAAVAGVGALVCLVWLAGAPDILRLVADSSTVRFNTGVCLLGSGLALLALQQHRSGLAMLLLVPVVVLSTATIVQYLAGIDLGVDQLVVPGRAVEHPGRMAPNTAAAFVVASSGLALLALGRSRPWALGIASLLGSLVAAFGGVALLGYAFDLTAAFEWAGLTRMALLTAACLVVLGLAMVLAVREFGRDTAANRTAWLASSVGVGAAGLGVLIAIAVRAEATALPPILFWLLLAESLGVAVLVAGTAAQARHMRLLTLALGASERRLQQVLDSVQAAVVVHRSDSSIEFLNPTAAAFLGTDASALMDRTADDPRWRFVREDGSPMPAEEYPVSRVLATGAEVKDAVLGLVGEDGSEPRWMVVCAVPMHDDAGRLRQVVVSFMDITERKRESQAFERQALTDALTGLPSRRHFGMVAERELARSQRSGEPLALVMLDVDHFKVINDRHGHAAGDLVLQQLATILRHELRGADMAARWGGEEFCVLLPQARLGEAVETAERLRRAIAAMPMILPDGAALQATASFGVTTAAPAESTLATMVARADQAMYAAKRAGRDQVCMLAAGDASATSA